MDVEGLTFVLKALLTAGRGQAGTSWMAMGMSISGRLTGAFGKGACLDPVATAACWAAMTMVTSAASGWTLESTVVALPAAAGGVPPLGSKSRASLPVPGAAGAVNPEEGRCLMLRCRTRGPQGREATSASVMGAKGRRPAGLPKVMVC